jgi:DNA-binding transcriptional LysR family regulator
MDMHRLKYFLCIADEGSLTRASEVLGIAQPALSRQVRLLESGLGVQLFARTPRGMSLTEEGAQLRAAIAGPLGQVELAMQNIASPLAQFGGGVVLGMPQTTAQVLAAPLLARLFRTFPEVKVAIVVNDSRQLVDDMLRGEVDIAVIARPIPDERLFNAELVEEELVVVGGPACGLSAQRPSSFRDLAKLPLTLPRSQPGLRSSVERIALEQRLSIDVRYETDSVVVQKDLIRAGEAYGILPVSAIRSELNAEQVSYCPLYEPAMKECLSIAVRPQLVMPRSFVFEFGSVIRDEASILINDGVWKATLAHWPEGIGAMR